MEHKVQAKLRSSINPQKSCHQLQMAMVAKSPLTATLWHVAVDSLQLTVSRNFVGVDIVHKQNLMGTTGYIETPIYPERWNLLNGFEPDRPNAVGWCPQQWLHVKPQSCRQLDRNTLNFPINSSQTWDFPTQRAKTISFDRKFRHQR